MHVADQRAETSERRARYFVRPSDAEQHFPAQVVELELVDRHRLWVELDGHQIQAECRETQRCFVDIEAGDLLVQRLAQCAGVRALTIRGPALRH